MLREAGSAHMPARSLQDRSECWAVNVGAHGGWVTAAEMPGEGQPRDGALTPFSFQVFVNFAKKQSDNLEQQETSPSCALQSPWERVLSLLRPRAAPTELRALVVEEQEDLETDDEGLISFEEERVRGSPSISVSPLSVLSLSWGPSIAPGPSSWEIKARRGLDLRVLIRGGGAWGLSQLLGRVPPPEPCYLCAPRLSCHLTQTRCAEELRKEPHPQAVMPSDTSPFPSLRPHRVDAAGVGMWMAASFCPAAEEDVAGATPALMDPASCHPSPPCPLQLWGCVPMPHLGLLSSPASWAGTCHEQTVKRRT